MNNEPDNILSNNSSDINNQKLIDYINNRLSTEEKLEMDKLMEEPGLLNDALQGLQQFNDTNNLSPVVDQLNAGLYKQLKKKTQRRQKRRLKNEQWIYLAVIIILLLVIIGFLVIRERLGA